MDNYTADNFFHDVQAEAEALKRLATPGELNKLDFTTFTPNNYRNCIYGQMTGNCKSARASLLIFSCCRRYFVNRGEFDEIGNVISNVNGENIDGVDTAEALRSHRSIDLAHFSAIEAYIFSDGANAYGLIAYLKSESDTLEL